MPPFLQKIIDKSPFLTKVYEILDLYGSRRMGRSAAAFAYYLMLSFFPLLICVASIIGRTRIDTGELLELLSEVIPPQVTETLVTFFGYIHDNYSQAMLWAGIILLFTAGIYFTLRTRRLPAPLVPSWPPWGIFTASSAIRACSTR